MANFLMIAVWVAMAALAPYAGAWSQEVQLREFIRSPRSSHSTSNSSSSTDRAAISRVVKATRYSGADGLSRLRAAHKIAALPGQPGRVDFDHYAGYVTVDEESGRALFYNFVEAPRHGASTKPLVLWLNGGPGCSSLGYGAMQEIGPFRVNSDNKTLSTNKHAWNNVANMIFLESPVGVGFSYSNTSSDYDHNGDERTAEDAYVFLVKWLELFPECKGRPFYIAGESYAGHYVPQLAEKILLFNTYNKNAIINLRGILVGNPYLDVSKNSKGLLDYFWSHGVMSDEVFENITRNCYSDDSDGTCGGAWDAFDVGQIDIYNIYAPICIDAPDGAGYYPSSHLPGYDPCIDRYTQGYLNDPAVQSAFHARTTNWSLCRNMTWKDAPDSVVPTIGWLISKGLPIWLYSGDFDSVCPLPATRYSIRDLGLNITTPWRPWMANKEVGGYVQQYTGGFTFLSVRGAGHDVPTYQAERALVLFDSFLKGMLPPNVKEE